MAQSSSTCIFVIGQSFSIIRTLPLYLIFAIQDWTVYVHNQDFWERLHRLERDIAYKETGRRGWSTYTELNTLLDSVHLLALVHTMISVSCVCIATYAAGIITLMGSAVVAIHLPGTLLDSKQQAESAGSSFQYVPYNHESTQTDIEEEIESILLDSISEEAEICNESYVENNILKQNVNHTSTGDRWNWFVDSVTFWLPNCSNSNSKSCIDQWKDQNSAYVTKTDFMIESDSFSQYSANEVETASKETLDSSLKISSQDWKYYVGRLSKITLSHG